MAQKKQFPSPFILCTVGALPWVHNPPTAYFGYCPKLVICTKGPTSCLDVSDSGQKGQF